MNIWQFIFGDNSLEMSLRQNLVFLLMVLLFGGLLWIIGSTFLDLIRYFAFRLSRRSSFTPRSWLFVLVASLWSILFVSRGQVASAATIEVVVDSETQPASHSKQDLISILSCSVVVAGLIFDIGKQRGNQLRQLQLNSRLSHPSASAIRTEVALRATLDVKDTEISEIYLSANSESPIFIPIGISESKIVFADIGRQSVISICADESVKTAAIVRAMVAATLFSSNSRAKPILLQKANDNTTDLTTIFSQVPVIYSVQEAIELAARYAEHCVLFTRSLLTNVELEQLEKNNLAVVCCLNTTSATVLLQANEHMWRLSPHNISITPYSLQTNEATVIEELLIDIDLSMQPDTSVPRSNFETRYGDAKKWNVMVRTLGPVDVQLADGTIIEFEKSKTKELLAWLTSHRARPTRSAARTALWEVNVADATFTNVVSDARRALNQTHLISSTEEWLPRTFNDQLPFHISIISDAEILESCITRAHGLAPAQAIHELHTGLELVRDLPFAGTGYLWPDAEGITSQLVLNVITASAMAAELDLQRGEIDGVFWATAKGLKVLGAHEELIALRMRAHALRGDLAGVRGEWHSYERAIKSDSWTNSKPSVKLVSLYNQLNSGPPVLSAR